MNNNSQTQKVKILLFDLETTANKGYYWGQNWETSIIENIEYGKILCYSAKWLHKKSYITHGWIDTRDELGIVKELWELLNEADAVVAHNGREFDVRKCTTAFAQYGLGPPSPYKVIDTKIEAKKYLSLPSYSLDTIADYFGLPRKLHHEGFRLWKRCIVGDSDAWREMKKYNKNDVLVLESVYLKLLPFMKLPVLTFGPCPRCGGEVVSRGVARNKSGVFKQYSCKSCGGWLRGDRVEKIKSLIQI